MLQVKVCLFAKQKMNLSRLLMIFLIKKFLFGMWTLIFCEIMWPVFKPVPGPLPAARIAALHKPAVLAWVVNLMVRELPDEIEGFLDLGDALRVPDDRGRCPGHGGDAGGVLPPAAGCYLR